MPCSDWLHPLCYCPCNFAKCLLLFHSLGRLTWILSFHVPRSFVLTVLQTVLKKIRLPAVLCHTNVCPHPSSSSSSALADKAELQAWPIWSSFSHSSPENLTGSKKNLPKQWVTPTAWWFPVASAGHIWWKKRTAGVGGPNVPPRGQEHRCLFEGASLGAVLNILPKMASIMNISSWELWMFKAPNMIS